MNTKRLLLVTSLLFTIIGIGGACSSVNDQSKTSAEPRSAMPEQPMEDGPLSVVVWEQQLVTDNPKRYAIGLELENKGQPEKPINLQRLTVKLINADGTERLVDRNDVPAKIGEPVCVSLSSESEISKVSFEAQGPERKFGPIVYDLTAAGGNTDQPLHSEPIDISTMDIKRPGPSGCFARTSLGCLYEVGRLKLTPPKGGTRTFAFLGFRGKGLLNYNRDDFPIIDADAGERYMWTTWNYKGESIMMPGFEGTFLRPEKGPVMLRDCWHFQVWYEIPEQVQRIKLAFAAQPK